MRLHGARAVGQHGAQQQHTESGAQEHCKIPTAGEITLPATPRNRSCSFYLVFTFLVSRRVFFQSDHSHVWTVQIAVNLMEILQH